jgi:hypothetical protein
MPKISRPTRTEDVAKDAPKPASWCQLSQTLHS